MLRSGSACFRSRHLTGDSGALKAAPSTLPCCLSAASLFRRHGNAGACAGHSVAHSVLQRRHGIATGLASSARSSRAATPTRSRQAICVAHSVLVLQRSVTITKNQFALHLIRDSTVIPNHLPQSERTVCYNRDKASRPAWPSAQCVHVLQRRNMYGQRRACVPAAERETPCRLWGAQQTGNCGGARASYRNKQLYRGARAACT